MAANTQGSNAFATNNSGGGVGLQTAEPDTGPNWANPNAPSPTYMAQSGSYGQYQQPNWITGGLYQANQPIQNYPVTNYGRWNYQNGATNGYGMGQSAWPSPQSITQPYGPPPSGDTFTGLPNPGQPPGQPPGAPPTYGGSQPTGQPGYTGNRPAVGDPRQLMPQGSDQASIAARAAMGDPNAQARMAASNPQTRNAAFAQFQGMNPQQQANYMAQNGRMYNAFQNKGLLSNADVNNLRGGAALGRQV